MAVEEIIKTTEVAPELGSAEYNTAMEAKFDASQVAETPEETPVEEPAAEVAEKPEGVPAKFYNKETGVVDYASLTKSYNELEKGKGKTKPKLEKAGVSESDALVLAQVKHDAAKALAEAEGATEEDKSAFIEADELLTLAKASAITAKKAEADADVAKDLVNKSGFDFDKLTAEYAEDGGLSEESILGLEAGGIPRATVESYIRGQEALATQWDNTAKAEAGGTEGYAEMVTWASNALSPEEIAAYDKAVNDEDIDSVKLAVRGLRAQYEDANGKEPELLGGTTSGQVSSSGYGSRAEMVKDMSDPQYARDAAYRQKVARKVAKTTAF